LKKVNIRFFFLLSVVFLSCQTDNFRADIPSYIKIQNFDLVTTFDQGSNSNKITDAWVTMDGNFLGAFEIPCEIPILEDGFHEFRVYPGIKANGISATRMIYPFYNLAQLYLKVDTNFLIAEENLIKLTLDSTLSLTAKTSYLENTEFIFIENFENLGNIFKKDLESDTGFILTNDTLFSFEGTSSLINLDNKKSYFKIVTSELYELNSINSAIMLEMNYKCDDVFKVGIIIENSNNVINFQEIMSINPKKTWNKIYIYMNDQVQLGNINNKFGIYIESRKSLDKESSFYSYDNVKWLQLN